MAYGRPDPEPPRDSIAWLIRTVMDLQERVQELENKNS